MGVTLLVSDKGMSYKFVPTDEAEDVEEGKILVKDIVGGKEVGSADEEEVRTL